MQTILGAGGAVGTELAKALTSYTPQIRLVSRHPRKINNADTLMAADLTNAGQVAAAVSGSEVVYLTVGIPYKARVWEEQWPRIMRNVIDACKQEGARLVFFDNMYMYHRDHLHHMTEDTPVAPSSRKGKVRAQVAHMLLDEVAAGNLQAMIVRAADFLGLRNSVLVDTVARNLKRGRKGNWMVDDSKVHSFTYVPDAARATALLGNTPDAYGQVWHLPTAAERLTGKEWIGLIARELNVAPRYSVLSPGMMRVLGLFIPVLREVQELTYQLDRDYYFDSSKFTARFGVAATPPAQAVRELLAQL